MNLFVIPSWYPHRCWPLEGIFLLDQAVAVGELHPDWTVSVSRWGQGVGRLSLAHLRRSPRCLVDALLQRTPPERDLRPNVAEFVSPALTWSESFMHGNRDAVLKANLKNLERATRRFGTPDILHAHVSYPAGWVAMRISESTGIPFVVTEHMGPFPLPVYEREGGQLEPFIREPLERAAERIAVSPTLCDRIAEFGIPRPRYIPNVVDEALYAPGPTQEKDTYTFFTLCQMETVKGIPDLLDAIARVVSSLPERERGRVRFRLGGTGSRIDDFRRRCSELGMDPWVSWLGFVPREDARREYRSCDCFVLASRHESFGIVLVEASAFGKPVIATRSGGPEAIVTPETGVLVDVGEPDQLARAMLEMLRGNWPHDAAVIRQTFLERFSRPAVVGMLDSVYRSVGARGAVA